MENDQPIKRPRSFYQKLWRNSLAGACIVCISLLVGILGYHWLADLSWVDSLENASMILAGMGPVQEMKSDAAKIFASFYALFSGVVFLSTIAIFISPVIHRFLTRNHLADDSNSPS